MEIVHAGAMEWGENLAAHRQGGMAHKLLFEGREGSPDNFAFVLARESADYFSPRHRHAWDQVRLCLEGSVPLAPGLTLDAGEVAYFPEGVGYGPQEGGTDRIVLVLQMGGASGQGFLSAAQVRRARAELSREGTFEGGVFHRAAPKKDEDAYEAIWRHAVGKTLNYPPSQYDAPILMQPKALFWRKARAGVRRKIVGEFPERGLALAFVHIAAGSGYAAEASSERRLIFVREGEGSCGGETCRVQTAIRMEPGEGAAFAAHSDMELFVISLAPVAG